MTKRIAIYARYSSDLQSQSSIEDQIRLCEARISAQSLGEIHKCYTDAGISGASLLRPGIQELMQDATNGAFDLVVCEALDRLSRDQEDIAGLYKRLEFAGVKIITLSEGEINTMHIGLKGTMNALFLQDLAAKTRRGLRGRVEHGKSGGGIAYGYNVVKQFNASGEAIRGDREIDQDQARIVRRIFTEYANDNKSPKAIAAQLNAEAIPSPSRGQWSQSTINGNRRRGTGILNNELYRGVLIWNRQRFIKDPATGKRVTRLNEDSEWIKKDIPELRIVPQDLWDAAKARQKLLDQKIGGFGGKKRPRHLLSGLLKCGRCGGGYSKINKDRYGCSNVRNKGESVCTNRRTIKGELLEEAVLRALQTHLMRDDLVRVFCDEYTKHYNALHSAQNSSLKRQKSELSKLEKERESLIQAIKDGIPANRVRDDLERVCEAQEALADQISTAESQTDKPLLHPSMARRYQQEIVDLRSALKDEHTSGEAAEHFRALVEKIVLTPKPGQNELSIDLYGELAGILSMAAQGKTLNKDAQTKKRLVNRASNDNWINEPSVQLVAGVGFEPTTFGL